MTEVDNLIARLRKAADEHEVARVSGYNVSVGKRTRCLLIEAADLIERLSPPLDGEGVIQTAAKAVFRSFFADDEDERQVDHKWEEWDEDRQRAFRFAKAALATLTPREQRMEEALRKIANGRRSNLRELALEALSLQDKSK